MVFLLELLPESLDHKRLAEGEARPAAWGFKGFRAGARCFNTRCSKS
jgi:hypothetical protein